MNIKLRNLTSASVVLGALAIGLPSVAQTTDGAGANSLTEVVVTAEHRVSTAQRTAASVSVRSGEELVSQGKYTLTTILEDVPGIVGGDAERVSGSLGSGTDNPASGLIIRGIKSNDGAGSSVTSTAAAAAIYVDGVYDGVGGGYDIDRVEVLRGPQGTLYGRSATSGVVAIHTQDPSVHNLGGDLSVEAGNYALRHVTGALNVPIIEDKLALRVSGNQYQRDGYYSPEGDRRSTTDFRAKLLFKPTENFSALLGYALEDNTTHTGGVAITQTTPNVYSFDYTVPVGSGQNNYRQYWAEFNLDLGPVAVTYIPALRTWYENALVVSEFNGLSFHQPVFTPTDQFFTNELRFTSKTDSALRWQAGVISYSNNVHDQTQLILDPIETSVFKSETRKSTNALGAFAEATWSLQPDTRLTAGLRFDHTEVQNNEDYTGFAGLSSLSISGAAGQRKFDNTTYKVRLEHDLTPKNLVYISTATGFSPGEVEIASGTNGGLQVLALNAETLTSYELGSKNRFSNGHLEVNGAVYYNDYAGYQSAGINLTPDLSNPTYNTVITPVKVYGVELEILAVPWTNGKLGLNLGYTHARESIPAEYAFFFARNTVPGVVPFEATLAYDHRLPLGGDSELTLHGDMRYGSQYDDSRLTTQDLASGGLPYIEHEAEVLGNLSATWAMAQGRYSITGYVRNVADSRERLGSILKETSTTSTTLSSDTVTPSLEDPRTFGVILSARF